MLFESLHLILYTLRRDDVSVMTVPSCTNSTVHHTPVSIANEIVRSKDLNADFASKLRKSLIYFLFCCMFLCFFDQIRATC